MPFQWSDITALLRGEAPHENDLTRASHFLDGTAARALGFVMVAVMIGQSGLQLQSIRTSRVRLQEEQEHLNRTNTRNPPAAGEAQGEIQAALDEDTPFTGKSGAVTSLAQAAHQLSQSTDDPSALWLLIG